MSETSAHDPKPSKTIALSYYTERDTKYPLTFYGVAAHLGISHFGADNAEENMRRAKAFFKIYDDMGKPLMVHPNGEPFTAEDVTPEFIAHHEGQTVNFGVRSSEDFDEDMLNLRAALTGVPRVSYIHIRRHTHVQLDKPCDIYQELNDQYHSESRRVEVYPDGRRLWREDGYHGVGTAENEYTEAEDVPGLSILNDRPGQQAKAITAEEFEQLWTHATSDSCGWIVEFSQTTPETPLDATLALYCTGADEGSGFCTVHREMARRIFPRLFQAD